MPKLTPAVIDEVRSTAVGEMEKWGLTRKGWRFDFNERKRSLGVCFRNRKLICLSLYFIERVPKEEILDTIRHEIAHALDFERHGEGSGHGEPWQTIAREVGAKPDRTYDGDLDGDEDWAYVLKFGEEVVAGYHRLPTNIQRRLPTMAMKGRPETKGKLDLYQKVVRGRREEWVLILSAASAASRQSTSISDPGWKYVLKYGDEVVGGYHRLPSNIYERLKDMFVTGRPETLGKLKLYERRRR